MWVQGVLNVCKVTIFSLRHEAERLEQKAKGALERQKITDEAEAEKARKELLELQASSAAVESTGQAKAEAQSRAEAAKIEGEAAVEQAKLKSQATKIEAVSINKNILLYTSHVQNMYSVPHTCTIAHL